MHHPGRQQRLNQNRYHQVVGLMLLACVLILDSAGQLRGQSSGQSTVKSAASIEVPRLIQQLSSPKFADREAASIHLKMAGADSISELVKAAQGSNPEVIARAIDILSYLYESSDTAVSLEADRALELLLNEGPAAASQRTEDAFAFNLATARRRNAILAIQNLGGILVPKVVLDDEGRKVSAELSEPDSIQHAILGRNWIGDLSSIKYLDRLRPELYTIYITSDASLTTETIGIYSKVLSPTRVELRGGYMGVSSGSAVLDPSRCEIDSTALNSPAERAGLKKGDWLTHLDGLPISGFVGLTTMLLSRKSGETILLDVLREPDEEGAQMEELEIAVTLGEWGAQPMAGQKPSGGAPRANPIPDRDVLPKPKPNPTPGPPSSESSPGKSVKPPAAPKK